MKKVILITQLVLLIGILILSACRSGGSGVIHTVGGPIRSDDLQFALTHEHLMSNFGKDADEADEYNEEELSNQVIPYLRKIKSLGVHSVFDCTTEYFGRRVDLLKIMADSSGLQVITNTGIYGAAGNRYVPEFAFNASSETISEVWIDEFEKGIGDSGIKPGFIKLAFDEGIPSEIDKKLFIAGIFAHLRTGMTLAVHTANNTQAAELQLTLLEQYGVSAEAWVWVHANLVNDTELLLNAASKGAWISLDGANESNVEAYIGRLENFRSENLLHKVLLSHDGDGYMNGSEIREFEAIMEDLIPAMLSNGFSQSEIEQLMIRNPKEAFTIRIRKI